MKKALSIILTVTMLLSILTVAPFTVSAAETEAEQTVGASSGTTGDCTWTLDDDGVLTISGNGAMGNYSEDSPSPWFESDITEIIIQNGVTSIGSSAFDSCESLTSVVISDSVKSVGEYTFSGCSSLRSVVIPNSVTNIDYRAFGYYWNKGYQKIDGFTIYGYKNSIAETYAEDNVFSFFGYAILSDGTAEISGYSGVVTELEIPSKLNNYTVTSIGENVFSDCKSLTSVIIPDSVISIGHSAFSGCKSLTSVIIPDSVISIGHSTFSGCSSLKSVTIGNSVRSIGWEAFNDCRSLTSVNIKDIAAWCGIDFQTRGSNPLGCAHNLYLDRKLVTDLVIPDSVTSIGAYAFYGCTSITSLSVPDSVKNIGTDAFDDTAWFNSLPDGVVYAGKVAFKIKGENITEAVIADGTVAIADFAFINCESLTSVTIPNTLQIIGNYAFAMDRFSSIIIPDSVIYIGERAFDMCSVVTSVTIGESVSTIGEYAFHDCNINSITIPKSVTDIGEKAVGYRYDEKCENFTIYGIKGSAAENYANENGFAFNSIYDYQLLADGTAEITRYNGEGGKIKIPSQIEGHKVTSIGSSVFKRNNAITSVTIPDSVTSIGDSAFLECDKLTSVKIGSSVKSIGNSAFKRCSSLTYVDIPGSVTSIGDSAFCECDSLTSATIGKSVKSIGSSAFKKCSSLNSVIIIPDSVTSIGDSAFANCSLEKAFILSEDGTIGTNAFANNKDLVIFCIKGSSAENFAKDSNIPFEIIVIGNVDGDGTVNINDATMIQKYVAELVTFTPEQLKAADTNGDGEVNINDATQIQKYIAELIDHLG